MKFSNSLQLPSLPKFSLEQNETCERRAEERRKVEEKSSMIHIRTKELNFATENFEGAHAIKIRPRIEFPAEKIRFFFIRLLFSFTFTSFLFFYCSRLFSEHFFCCLNFTFFKYSQSIPNFFLLFRLLLRFFYYFFDFFYYFFDFFTISSFRHILMKFLL